MNEHLSHLAAALERMVELIILDTPQLLVNLLEMTAIIDSTYLRRRQMLGRQRDPSPHTCKVKDPLFSGRRVHRAANKTRCVFPQRAYTTVAPLCTMHVPRTRAPERSDSGEQHVCRQTDREGSALQPSWLIALWAGLDPTTFEFRSEKPIQTGSAGARPRSSMHAPYSSLTSRDIFTLSAT